MNDIIKKENDNYVLAESTLKELNEILIQEAKIKAIKEKYVEKLTELMGEKNIKKFDNPKFTITYFEPSTTIGFDTTKFKNENLAMYNKYCKTTNKKAYIKIVSKVEKNED